MGVEPTDDHEGLSFAALPVCAPLLTVRASPMGFEPTISCVTGRRALRAAPRGRNRLLRVAQVGVEPTASLVQSQASLPTATVPHCLSSSLFNDTHGCAWFAESCGSRNRTYASWFKARHHYQQRLPRIVSPRDGRDSNPRAGT